ncbi:MAG: hypothetical protein MJZ30_11520 [Paludibacteraceae bacterium]|nr:hypothetical protein [Paludibacteraceae bacterium]
MAKKTLFKTILNKEAELREDMKKYISEHLKDGRYEFKEPIRCCEFDEGNGYPRAFFILSIRTNPNGTRMYALKFPIENDGDYYDEGDVEAHSENCMLSEHLLEVCQTIFEETV